MPQVKLKIEVNGGTTASGFNVSVDKSANNVGFSSMPQSFDDSFKGTKLLVIDSLYINDKGFLANGVNEDAGQLQSEQNKRQFVYGKTDANAEYELTLTMTTDTGTFDRIVIIGDSVGNQFPIEAIVDGTTTIYSDDPIWALDLGDKQSSHTIKFTKWNKANYNACFNQVKIMLQYLEIDRFNGLKTVESLSQSTPDASSIYYGTLANSGSAEIVDIDGEIADMINDGLLDNSNVPVELYVDNHLVQSHITTDSDYNTDKILSLQFTNKLEYWDKITYGGYPYADVPKTAYEVLEDVLTSLGYNSTQITGMLSEQIIYGDDNQYGTIKSYLELITIPYPYLPSDTYRNTIDKFCRLAQLQVFQKDNGDIKFISARPIIKNTEISNAIIVPKYAQISNLNKTIVLKNKYDAIDLTNTKVSTEYNYDSEAYTKVIENSTFDFDEEDGASIAFKGTATFMHTVSRIDPYYTSGSFFIPYDENLGTIKYISISGSNFSENNDNRYYFSRLDDLTPNDVSSYLLNSVLTPIDYDTAKSLSVPVTDPEFVPEYLKEGVEYKNNKTYQDMPYTTYTEGQTSLGFGGFYTEYDTENKIFKFYSHSYNVGTATSSISDKTNIQIEDIGTGYNITYKILSKLLLSGYCYENGVYSGSSGRIHQYYLSEKYAKGINITIIGDKRSLVFENVDASTPNISNAKTIATIQGSELLQTGTKYNNTEMATIIKNNIKNDYSSGISSGNIQLFCTDFYNSNNNKVVDFNDGEALQTNDMLSIVGDNKLWRVTGRQFKYDGQSTTNVEVEEIKQAQTTEFVFTGLKNTTQYQVASDEDEVVAYRVDGLSSLYGNKVLIPSSYNGLPVVSIKSSAFSGNTDLVEITIPDSIDNIGDFAFRGCTNLETVNLSANVTKIKTYVFDGCSSLENINLSKITEIQSRAFQNCSSLSNIILSSGLTYLGDFCFMNCSSLTIIRIYSNVTHIGKCAFNSCSGLLKVYLYNTTNSNKDDIDASASNGFFTGCSSSLDLHIPNSVSNPASVYGYYWNIYDSNNQSRLIYTSDL